ncbi:hypothetical protein KJ039_02370 [bacterium]|nr:hypothetical protein [bacterium]
MAKNAGKRPGAKKRTGKIRITEVDARIAEQNGLFDEGCYGCACKDECCGWGCDVDYATYKLILKYRALIEPLIGAKVEDCFSTGLKKDDDYIGGSFRETAVRKEDDICAFHLRGSKGCSLFYLWAVKGLPKRVVPTICRTYPITWHRGRLFIDTPLKKNCKAKEKVRKGVKVPSLYETQKKEIRALFDIAEKELRKLKPKAKTKPKK